MQCNTLIYVIVINQLCIFNSTFLCTWAEVETSNNFCLYRFFKVCPWMSKYFNAVCCFIGWEPTTAGAERRLRGRRRSQRHPLHRPRHGGHGPRHHLRRPRGQGLPHPWAQAHRTQSRRSVDVWARQCFGIPIRIIFMRIRPKIVMRIRIRIQGVN